jgi:hypothetical protein
MFGLLPHRGGDKSEPSGSQFESEFVLRVAEKRIARFGVRERVRAGSHARMGAVT